MELRATNIDPHVVDTRHQIRVAGEAQAAYIEEGCERLVGNAQVYMLELNDVPDILDLPVVCDCVAHDGQSVQINEASNESSLLPAV